jgi:Tol biopolymer transport system component/tRNA A-37 threonylcarbamoyl transferase component Bud32
MIGRTVAHYEILEKLGEGGMGVVYKARDTRLNRFVALKLLPTEKLGDEEHLRRFTQEARTASALNHPNIITIHDIASAGGVHFIVMEYVAGKTLDHLIPRKGMRIADVLKIGEQIGDALAAAANAGVIHRDVKPGNVMVSDTNHVKVLDFGLAKLCERAASSEQATATIAVDEQERPHTREGTVIGTISYMSPEQAEGKPLDPRSDIFSFGAVLYEMVTGQRAFRGETRMSTISAILRDDPQPAGQLSAGVPRDLDKIIVRCLRKNPERRFQSMADVRVALLELKEESESGKLLMADALSAPPRRKTMRVFAWAATLLVAAAVYFAMRPRAPALSSTADVRSVPFTSYTGPQVYPAFSPDSNQIAFSWAGERGTVPHIYVKLIGTETPLLLTSSDAPDSMPAWAPGGQSIAFVRFFSGRRLGIYQVSALGGPERRITEFVAGRNTRPSWSPDGKWIFAGGRTAEGEPSRIWRIAADTGEKQALALGGGSDEFSPALSPDAKQLAFSRLVGDLNTALFVVPLDQRLQLSGTPRELPAPPGVNFDSAWTPDSRELVFLHGSAAGGRLWRVPADGNTPARELSIAPEGSACPAIASKGNRLAFTRHTADVNIWRMPITGPGKTGKPEQIINSTRLDNVRPGAFSPDGRKIAFESERAGAVSVWLADTNGARPTLLTGSADYLSGSPSWSPDGRWLAFDNRKEKRAAIFIISADGGAPRRLLNVAWDHVVPWWSRDGNWIYFTSERTGRFEIYKAPASGGEPVQITRNGGFAPVESPDGKSLYYNRTRLRGNYAAGSLTTPLLRIPAEGGQEAQILEAVYPRTWIVAPEGIWFAGPSGEKSAELRFMNFSTGHISTVAHISRTLFTGFALSPDGRTLLYNQLDHELSEITLVENFR